MHKNKPVFSPPKSSKKRKTAGKGKSECPVCSQSVPTHMINSHLDYCFQQQQTVEVTPDVVIYDDDDFVSAPPRSQLPAKSPVKTRSKRRQMADKH